MGGKMIIFGFCINIEKMKREDKDQDDTTFKAWYKRRTDYFTSAIDIAAGKKPGLFRGKNWGPVLRPWSKDKPKGKPAE